MTVTFKRFEAAHYLTDAEDIAAYLDAVSEEGDHVPTHVARGLVPRAYPLRRPPRRLGSAG